MQWYGKTIHEKEKEENQFYIDAYFALEMIAWVCTCEFLEL